MIVLFITLRLLLCNGTLQEKHIPWESSQADKVLKSKQRGIESPNKIAPGKRAQPGWKQEVWQTARTDHSSFLAIVPQAAEKHCDEIISFTGNKPGQRVRRQ